MSRVDSYGDAFFTDTYGAFRWDRNLCSRPGTWYLVSLNNDFDRMRGVGFCDVNITCVVDDFGNLVRVNP